MIHIRHVSHQAGVVCRQVKTHCIDPLTHLFIRIIALLGACFQSTLRRRPLLPIAIFTREHIRERLRQVDENIDEVDALLNLFPDRNGLRVSNPNYPNQSTIFRALKGFEKYQIIWHFAILMGFLTPQEALQYNPTPSFVNGLIFRNFENTTQLSAFLMIFQTTLNHEHVPTPAQLTTLTALLTHLSYISSEDLPAFYAKFPIHLDNILQNLIKEARRLLPHDHALLLNPIDNPIVEPQLPPQLARLLHADHLTLLRICHVYINTHRALLPAKLTTLPIELQQHILPRP